MVIGFTSGVGNKPGGCNKIYVWTVVLALKVGTQHMVYDILIFEVTGGNEQFDINTFPLVNVGSVWRAQNSLIMSKTLVLFLVALSVVCVIVNAEAGYIAGQDIDEEQELTGENAALLARVRRALVGTYKSRSSTEKKHHRHVSSSRMKTNADGETNYERRTHRERGGSSELNKKSGSFAIGKSDPNNNNDGGFSSWDDDESW